MYKIYSSDFSLNSSDLTQNNYSKFFFFFFFNLMPSVSSCFLRRLVIIVHSGILSLEFTSMVICIFHHAFRARPNLWCILSIRIRDHECGLLSSPSSGFHKTLRFLELARLCVSHGRKCPSD